MLRRTWFAQALPACPWLGRRCGIPDPQGWREASGGPFSHSHCVSWAWQECLSRLLSPCGPVQSVELQGKPELAESSKEPKSKFFHPKPVPVSLQVLGSAEMGARVGWGSVPSLGGRWCQWQWDIQSIPCALGQPSLRVVQRGWQVSSLHSFPQTRLILQLPAALSTVLAESSEPPLLPALGPL